ncbi:MAG: ABC transporter substrate-binding protein [Armatimonadetes bacterium]|nr:ABC transporter substrate-binding protein [Armatimonadota bacterium]
MNVRRAFLCMLALLSLLAGCSKQEKELVGGKDRPKEYFRMICMNPGATEIIAGTFQMVPAIVGRSKSDNYPSKVETKPVVVDVKPDYEKIVKLKPDLIVYDSSLFSESDVEPLKKTNAELYDIHSDTLAQLKLHIRELSSMMHNETVASKSIDEIEDEEMNASANPLSPTPTVAYMIPDTNGMHMIAGTSSFWADAVNKMGGKLVGPSANKFVTLNAESLIKDDPDYIITAGSPDPIVKDSRFAVLKAVKNQHVYGINDEIALRVGARVVYLLQSVRKIISGQVVVKK